MKYILLITAFLIEMVSKRLGRWSRYQLGPQRSGSSPVFRGTTCKKDGITGDEILIFQLYQAIISWEVFFS